MSKLEKIQEAVEKKKVKKVAKFTDDADSTVRAAAFEALGAFPGDEYALEICQNTIRDGDPAVRLAVAKALAKIGNDHVVEALRHQMLSETDSLLIFAFFHDEIDCVKEKQDRFSKRSCFSFCLYIKEENAQTISCQEEWFCA